MARGIKKDTQSVEYRGISPPGPTLLPPGIVGPTPDTLNTLRPELSAKMNELNTSMVNVSTIDRFLGPIQNLIESLIEEARDSRRIARERKERKAQERAQEITRLLKEAEAEMRKGNWSSAISKLDRVLKLDKNVYEAVYLKAICLAALQRLKEAIKLASNGARRCPQPQLRAAFNNLVKELQFIMSILPMLKGIAAMLQGQYRDAIGHFEEARRKNPDDSMALYYKAVCLMHTERWQDALDILKQTEWEFRDNPIYHYHMSVCYMKLGDTSKARSALREARRKNPGSELSRLFDSLEKDIDNAPVVEAINAGRWEEAQRKLEDIIRYDSRNAWAHYHIAVCHAKIAEGHLLGRYPDQAAAFQAITLARQAVDKADSYCDQGDTSLRNAIDNLSRQLPSSWGF